MPMSEFEFLFKPFAEMTPADYAEVGFRSGLEIHQQLLTEKKLFCRCPAGRYSDRYDAEILRHMRPTLSELGEYDGTALMEFKTRKEIIYRINRETVCTYEMDDTPPFMIDEQALDRALGVALLYGLNLVDEIHIARKQYLDGSIPTGFQRTTILGVNGSIPYKDRRISIVQLGLEEDACREVSDVGHRRTYLTDRLGMPLIETVTGPDMRTPQEVAEVAQILRRLVRSTGHVRTGMGAAREDVNVSVRGGTRIEIKGVPRIPRIPLLTYHEAMRQWNLLRLREELRRRGVTPETFRSGAEDVTRILHNTSYHPIREALDAGAGGHGRRPARLPRPPGLADADEHPLLARDLRPRPGRRLPDQAPQHRPLRQLRRDPLEPQVGGRPQGRQGDGGRHGRRRLGQPGRRQDRRPGDRHPGPRSDRRRPLRDAPGAQGRDQRLRAHPARPRPDVPRHGPASQADHGGAAGEHPEGHPRAHLDARGLVPRDRSSGGRRRTAGRLAPGRPLRGPGQGLGDRRRWPPPWPWSSTAKD